MMTGWKTVGAKAGLILSVATILAAGAIAVAAEGHGGPETTGTMGRSPHVRTVTVRAVAFEFVQIPAGEFLMGSETGHDDEKPVHRVRINRRLEVGKTEVTVRQFRAFVEDAGHRTDAEKTGWAWSLGEGWRWRPAPGISWRSPGFSQTDDNPAVCVSWRDAVAFCEWLSGQTGTHCRLPSEAEWEYACRAGSTGDYAGVRDEMGWHLDIARTMTHPVAQKKPNAWGLYDMHGNVWEFCQDLWHPNYEGAPTDGSPWLTGANSRRVVRGGAATRDLSVMRSAARYVAPVPECASINFGFRVVRSDAEAPKSALTAPQPNPRE